MQDQFLYNRQVSSKRAFDESFKYYLMKKKVIFAVLNT